MYFGEYRCPTLGTYLRLGLRALLVSGVHAVLLVLAVAAADEEGHRGGARFPNSSQVTAGHGGTFPHSLKQTMFLAVPSIYYSLNVKSTPEAKGPDKIKVLLSLFVSNFMHLKGQNGSQIISRESLGCRVSYLFEII